MSEGTDFLIDTLKFTYQTPEGDEVEIDFYTELTGFSVPKDKLRELPATYAFVGTITAVLLARAKEFEDELEIWDAEEDYELRQSGWTGEAAIKKQIKTNPIWLKKRGKINIAWREYMKAKAMLDAISLKFGVLETMHSDSEVKSYYARPSILARADRIKQPKIKTVRVAKPAKKRYKISGGKE
ncbi:hypothetical protein LCGC14_1814820 [marine sediment metagenome]|uniref:Uncharacterized protein n=1 Tax=marine sediment metagenome TaxID=412755 RepID=A0A0F9JKA6_9ZZZZ